MEWLESGMGLLKSDKFYRNLAIGSVATLSVALGARVLFENRNDVRGWYELLLGAGSKTKKEVDGEGRVG